MAEGWTNNLKGDNFEAYSAGLEKQGVDRLAIEVMAEENIDISRQKSKLISELPETGFDYVVTICDKAEKQCPSFPGNAKFLHKSFPDPPTLAESVESKEEKLVYYL